MKIKAFAIIDTNVLISSAISKKGFTQDILELIKCKNIIPIFDQRVLNEYYKVFHYDKFIFEEKDIYDVLYHVMNNGLFIKDVKEAKETLKDKKDIPFFEVKMSSSDLNTYLVTGNIKHFPDSDTIVTPKEMISIMNYLEKFVFKDDDYEKNIEQLINNIIKNNKYILGKNLLDIAFNTEEQIINKDYFK